MMEKKQENVVDLQIKSEIFLNIGKLLTSDEYINKNINKDYFIDKDNISISMDSACYLITKTKTQEEYKTNYITNLEEQIKTFEKNKKLLLVEYNELLVFQKKTSDNIEFMNKKITVNKIYKNSATNFITLYNQRINKKLQKYIDIFNSITTKLDKIKKEILFLDDCIYKINGYKLLY